MKNLKTGYGVFLQEGGPIDMSASADQQIAAEQMPMEDQQDPQMMAEEFLQAFSQLPPEVQQFIVQTLTQDQ